MSLPIIQKLSEEKALKIYESFETDKRQTWCSNCGNYGIQNAVNRALAIEGLDRTKVALCYDVGCCGNGADKFEGYTIHGLHGRVIPLAAGAALANTNMKVMAFGGDGATFSEGVNHLVHGVRNDFPMVFVLHNNENYGLTTGQASSLTRKGCKMNASPDGVYTDTINPLDFVLSLKPSFVARAFSGNVDQLTGILCEALKHRGFAFIDVLQSCPTYNRETPEDWYNSRVFDVKDLEDYNVYDIWQARKIVQDEEERIATGILFRNPDKVPFLDAIPNRKTRHTPLTEEVKHMSIKEFI